MRFTRLGHPRHSDKAEGAPRAQGDLLVGVRGDGLHAHQTACTNAWPGVMTEITPAHMHAHVEVLVSAGTPLTFTVADPGVHGPGVTGMHGCGVKTPCAAAVAAMTCGLDGLMHKPKGGMFTVGTKSLIVHAIVVATTVPGVAVRNAGGGGLVPIEHLIWAPVETVKGISSPSSMLVVDRFKCTTTIISRMSSRWTLSRSLR
jgi:hypothetical protein